jgi:hypothetical protein
VLVANVDQVVFVVSLYKRLEPRQVALKWALPLLLGGAATGAFQTADNLTAQAQAIRAYNTTKGF